MTTDTAPMPLRVDCMPERAPAARACPVCGGADVAVRYGACRDLLFATPGEFSVYECETCGALSCRPQITPDEFGVYYRASYYPTAEQILRRRQSRGPRQALKRWALRRFWGPARRDTVLRRAARRALSVLSNELRMAVPVCGGGRILEIGCSSGEQLYILQQYGWQVSGIEPSADACAEARKLGVPVQERSLENAELPANGCDVIELFHVFEHLADPASSLAILRDALAPGGRIILTLPNGLSLGLKLFGRYWRGLEVPRHYATYTPRTLRLLCGRLGLRVCRVRNLVAPEVIVGSIKFALKQNRPATDPPSAASAEKCGARYRPDRRLRNLAGRAVRHVIALCLLPGALLGRGEVMQVEICRD